MNLGDANSAGDAAIELFSKIVNLTVGEALMFAPSAIVGVTRLRQDEGKGEDEATETAETAGTQKRKPQVRRLAHGVLKIRIRNRTTADGGRSIMAA